MMVSTSPEQIASGYFTAVQEAFERAKLSAGGPFVQHYRIGGQIIQLSFANPSLMPLLCPAIEHLALSGDSRAALEILLWDSESTGVTMPDPPWHVKKIVRRGEIWRVNQPRVKINYNPHNSTYDLIDLDKNLGVFQANATSHISQHESGSPVLQILKWWFNQQAQYIIHAGAVGNPDGGVLLVGRGGSGKSTTALVCLDSGLSYVGDDYCLLANGERPYVHSLYSSAKVNLNKIDWFPFLKSELSPFAFPGAEKALFLLNHQRNAKMLPGFPIKAVLLPQVTGLRLTEVSPVSPAQAMLSLAPSTIFQFRGTETQAVEAMSRLVKQVPCYALKLGTDLSTIADSIRHVLQ